MEGAHFDFGGAAYVERRSVNCQRNIPKSPRAVSNISLTLIFVAPFTDFSNELAISSQGAQEGACDSHSSGTMASSNDLVVEDVERK